MVMRKQLLLKLLLATLITSLPVMIVLLGYEINVNFLEADSKTIST